MEKLFTCDEVAEILKLTPFTIRKYIREGKIESYKIGGKNRVGESALTQFIQSNLSEQINSDNKSSLSGA